jgi:glycosyltransferase involved in cell wall biosynthesis
VINNLGSGGAESMLINLVKELNKIKNKEDVFEILLLTDNKISYTIPDGIKIHILSNSSNRFSLRKFKALCKFIKKNKYDIIHSHLFPTQYYVAICKKLTFNKPKIITTEHNTTNKRRKYFITRWIDKFVYRLYDKIIFISKGTQKQFIKDYPSFNDKGIIINNGIPINQFTFIEKKNLNKSKIKLLMVARFNEQKDHYTLLNALKKLDSNIELSLVGEGNMKKEIQDYAKKLNIENRVHFLGFRKDVAKIYNEHDIFVLSSNWEGFGLVVIEAMASGLPVVASNVSGLKEVTEGAGLLFEKGNAEDLANNIQSLIKNNDLRLQLISKGKERANEYDIKKLTLESLNLYSKML